MTNSTHRIRATWVVGAIALLLVCATAMLTTPAFAAPGAGWEATTRTLPTNLPPGGTGLVYIDVFNVGAADSEGSITVTDELPPGLTATDAGTYHEARVSHEPQDWDCTGSTVVRCTSDPANLPTFAGGGGIQNGYQNTPTPALAIAVNVAPEASGALLNRVTVAGGGALGTANATDPVTVSATPASFGIEGWDAWFSNEDGTIDTQAGSHPYAATFSINFNSVAGEGGSFYSAGGEVRNVVVELPPGLVGDPTAVPQCTREEFDAGPSQETHCPADSQIGISTAGYGGVLSDEEKVYNLVPPPGVAASFGFTLVGNDVFLDSSPRTGGDYGISTRTNNVPEGRGARGATITLWGVPGDPSHNRWRCFQPNSEGECNPSGAGLKPFLTLPTACAGPQKFSLHISEWENPNVTAEASFLSHNANDEPTGYTGCEHLSFAPTIKVAPDTAKADTPAGLTVEVTPPVGGLSIATGLSTSDIQNTTVELPEGLVINPGQAAGLQACQSFQDGVGTEGEPSCPAASKVGTVQIATPLLPEKLEGNVYVLQSNPPELKLLVAADADGVNLKLVGVVHLSEQTGQLTTTFEGTPELPFTAFKLSFSGGAQAALDTPTQCGTYGSTSDFSPWSFPFTPGVFPTADFSLTEGPEGSVCPAAPLPFAPALTAGATTDQAGGFTDFSLLLRRGDGQQRIDGLQFNAPEGLTGFLSKVPLCTNAQAETNECPAASKIGHALVESGPGPYPLIVPEPGQEPAPIYLTESYDGAPFGLSIVVPLHVGPFTLPTQRVRAKIEVNPYTAALTVTTNSLPQVVGGVPTDLREIDAVIERPDFMVNPTNCNPSEFTGTAYGTAPSGQNEPSASAVISSHFQVGACQALKFTPRISFSTNGKTSKQNGADLVAKVTYPNAPQGTEANVGYVKVELPKALPSRLTTLQKACLAKVFEVNPAACPPESKIGYAVVHTPVLPVPLTGPAIFVSHGGEAFPSLTVVLQGYGVKIDLVGTTFISKAGITSTTFKTVPDTPFSTFELVLPQGPYSALTANGNLCKQKLVIPNEWVGANGALLRQDSTLNVEGCAPAITVVSHNVKGTTATIQVSVPAAGKLVATGKGVSKASKTAKGATTLTVKLTLAHGEAAALSKHRGRKLKAKIGLTFTPKKGGKLKTTTTVLIG